VLITPHIGFNSREAGANMLRIAIETLEAFVRGDRLHVVNEPEGTPTAPSDPPPG
jgi:phosphoglycerate dehydrogenase-like enzyme